MLDIFDYDDAPKERTTTQPTSDIVGRIKGGYQEDNRPVASTTLVFTTDDPTVASAIAERFGGEVEELEVDKGDDHRIVSDTSEVELLVHQVSDLRARFAYYGQGGLVYATDGRKIVEGKDFTGATVGEDWRQRPESIAEWKKDAQAGRAPKPDIKLRAQLAAMPELGTLQYSTSGWSLVSSLSAIERELTEALEKADGGPASVTLTFDEREIKKGPNTGRTFTVPSLRVNGPASI
ncbi:hypothetical protein [Prauserella muralis]|uniref:Uncharacterized protein n=1 Tax=Prauserella muralis TaxID=588067 RepID=A0A2V4AKR4_9PSEU|nr:hypothetical protein [Prauserella muralis]PXY20865.1 hypothetical protein BAY60_25515 [Prauserella muralis]TWE29905.1 hypothetical protein FHX69_2598 [Prauserella muralis]